MGEEFEGNDGKKILAPEPPQANPLLPPALFRTIHANANTTVSIFRSVTQVRTLHSATCIMHPSNPPLNDHTSSVKEMPRV